MNKRDLPSRLAQNEVIALELSRESLVEYREKCEVLEAELERLRALKCAVKTLLLYLPDAVREEFDEALAGAASTFARDAVVEALARVGVALADD